jgi:hypothetical protein
VQRCSRAAHHSYEAPLLSAAAWAASASFRAASSACVIERQHRGVAGLLSGRCCCTAAQGCGWSGPRAPALCTLTLLDQGPLQRPATPRMTRATSDCSLKLTSQRLPYRSKRSLRRIAYAHTCTAARISLHAGASSCPIGSMRCPQPAIDTLHHIRSLQWGPPLPPPQQSPSETDDPRTCPATAPRKGVAGSTYKARCTSAWLEQGLSAW